MQDPSVKFLIQMLRTYSPTGREADLSRLLAAEMKERGYSVRIDRVGNVIGEAGKGDLHVLMCGHMDTVPGRIPVRIEDNRIHGRGAVDAKSSLAAMILAASNHSKKGTGCEITVAAVVEEEGKGRGVKELLRQGLNVDFGVFGEPSGVENVTIGYKGSLHLQLSCHAPSGHSSVPWAYPNAVEKSYELWQLIKDYTRKRTVEGSHYRSLTSCITRIEGGTHYSTVPGECGMHLDFRVPPDMRCEEVLLNVEKLIARHSKKNPTVKFGVKVWDKVDPFEISSGAPLARAFAMAVRQVRGKPAKLLRKTGTGDANILGAKLGIPVVTYGPGDSRMDHAPDEYVEIEDFLDSIAVYERAIENLIKMSRKRQAT